MTLIFTFPECESFSKRLGNYLNLPVYTFETKIFPDGESYVRYPIDVRNEDIIIVQNPYPDQDRKLQQLYLAIDAAHDLGADKVIIVLPYFAYSRQDRRFRDGEAISLKTILKIFKKLNVYAVLTVDIHKPQAFTYEDLKCINIEPFSKYAEYIRNTIGIENLVLLSPDVGSLWRVERVGKLLNIEFDYLEKFRDRITGEITVKPKSLNVEGKNVIIIDDMIATGGTIVEASKILKKQGVKKIYTIATHCLLLGNADQKILNAGVEDVICSDTIECRYTKISTIELIGEELRKLI